MRSFYNKKGRASRGKRGDLLGARLGDADDHLGVREQARPVGERDLALRVLVVGEAGENAGASLDDDVEPGRGELRRSLRRQHMRTARPKAYDGERAAHGRFSQPGSRITEKYGAASSLLSASGMVTASEVVPRST